VVGVVGLLNPVAGVVLGVALAGEAFGLAQGVGLALVLGGVALGSLPQLRKRLKPTRLPQPITGQFALAGHRP
jgi:probable blue pigment (indigoidine) exporter